MDRQIDRPTHTNTITVLHPLSTLIHNEKGVVINDHNYFYNKCTGTCTVDETNKKILQTHIEKPVHNMNSITSDTKCSVLRVCTNIVSAVD